jgi:glutaredoxin
VEKSKISIGTGEDEPETTEVFETDPIKFYTKPECPTCDQARTYFEEMEIPFEEVDISEDTAAAVKMERNFGHNNVPTMKVGNKSVTGYQKATMGKILKSAGYNIQTEDSESSAEVLEVPAENQGQ